MNKTDARERVALLLFESDSKNQTVDATLAELDVSPDKYVIALLEDYSRLSDRIATLLANNTKGWASDRLPGFDRAVLRMAITELVRSADTPVGTVISEAVKLCETYSTPESPRFVNGVLGTIAHNVRGVDLIRSQVPDNEHSQDVPETDA